MPDMKSSSGDPSSIYIYIWYIWYIWELGKKKTKGKRKNNEWKYSPNSIILIGKRRRGKNKEKKKKKEGKSSGQPLQVVLLPVNKESTNVLFGDTHFSFFSLPKYIIILLLFKASLLCSALPLKLLCFSVSFLFFSFFSSLFSISFPNSRTVFSSIWRLHKGEGLRFFILWFCGSCRFQFLFSFS